MKCFLLIGQSNMAGRGDFGEVPEIINEKCFMLRNGRWQPMSEPINPDRSVFPVGELKIHSGVGLAASFADAWAKEFNEDVGLIPCADGGTMIREWQPGEALYTNAVMQTRLALRESVLAGILWHQGESDSGSMENVALYRKSFLNMLVSLKKDIGVTDVPLIIGELGDFVKYYKAGKYAFSDEMNKVLHALSEELPDCGIASAKGLECRADNIHFNSASYRELGLRYFREYCRIIRRNRDNALG